MKKVKGVKKFAKQYLNSVEPAEIPQGIEQLSAVAGLMEKDKNFRNLMVSPIFADTESRQVISHISQKLKMPEKTAKYLEYLSETRAIAALPAIIESITALYLEMKKRSRAVVTSPAQLGKDDETKLAASLKQMMGREVDLEFLIDPSLLGGVRIKVGSTMYDSSIKGQLGLLKDKLIKG